MIAYEDGAAAMDWLARVLGFREQMRMMSDDGKLAHGEMETDHGLIMLATPSPHYEAPKHHREHCERARNWSTVPWVIDGVLVYVNDIDEHFERAKREGAAILSKLEEGFPGRRYRAEDLEGHRWMFLQRG
jgi:uncharacterized glyoxalase superfamily protein PhnB